MVRGVIQQPKTPPLARTVSETLARSPAVTRGTAVIVEEKKIGEAVIARPGAVVPGGGVTISIDEHKRVKSEVDKAASRGMCPSIGEIATAAGLTPDTVDTHFRILQEDEYGAMCSLERFCSHNACKGMLDKIHRWRGEA